MPEHHLITIHLKEIKTWVNEATSQTQEVKYIYSDKKKHSG